MIECQPKNQAKKIPLLFIHGAWHGAWCWKKNYLPYFAERGYRAYALNLRGHGAGNGKQVINNSSIADYVEEVSAMVGQIKDKPVLIGHSMGGAIVQKYIEFNQEKIRGVVLMASAPSDGLSLLILLRWCVNFPKSMFYLLLLNRGKKLTENELNIVSKCFFSPNMDEKKKKLYTSFFVPESNRVIREICKRLVATPKQIKIPLLIMGAENDLLMPTKYIKEAAKEYLCDPFIHKGMSHDMMLDPAWEDSAARILDFLSDINKYEKNADY